MKTKKTIHVHRRIPSRLDWAKHYWDVKRVPAAAQVARIRAKARADFQEREDVLDYRVREDRARIAREHAGFMEQRYHAMEAKKEEVRRKAQFDAANFEYRYTAKQKHLISRIRSAEGAFSNDPRNSAEDIANVKTKVSEAIMNVKPSWLPRLSPHPEGEGVGDIWDNQGVMTSRKQSGETWQIDVAKTAAGQAQLAKFKLDQEQLKFQRAHEKSLFDLRVKLLTTDVAGEGGMKRSRLPEEVNKIMQFLQAPRVSGGSRGGGAPRSTGRRIGPNRVMAPLTPRDKEYGGASQHVSSDADYEKLSPGARFIDPEGELRVKPELTEGEQ